MPRLHPVGAHGVRVVRCSDVVQHGATIREEGVEPFSSGYLILNSCRCFAIGCDFSPTTAEIKKKNSDTSFAEPKVSKSKPGQVNIMPSLPNPHVPNTVATEPTNRSRV